MKNLIRRSIVALAAILTPTLGEAADAWPAGSVRIVVPFPAGGAPDLTARIIADQLSKKSGRTFLVENKPGGSGSVGAQEVARSAPDGASLLVTINSFFSITPHFFKIGIDPLKDLSPIIETARNSLVFVGNPGLEPKTLADLVSYIKAKPGKITVASASHGTLFHVAAILFNDLAGIDMNHVGYRGSGGAQNDVIAGHVPLLFDALVGAAENISAGNLRAYAVNSGAGQENTLGIPTFRDLGYPDMENLMPWIMVAGPANMPEGLTQKISEAISEVLRSEEYLRKMKQLRSGPPKTNSPAALKADLKLEVERLAAFLKGKGVTAKE